MNTQDSIREPPSQTPKRAAAPVDGNLSKKRNLGFEEYADSPVLSDVTIHYGDAGELSFEAHKVVLSARSHWFRAAFTGGFKESEAKTIRLIGDDPASVKAMLTWVYNQKIMLPKSDEFPVENVIYCVELFRVADKYDLHMLYRNIQRIFLTQLGFWNQNAHTDSKDPALDEKNVEMFCALVERVYTLPNIKHSHPMVKTLLFAIGRLSTFKILRNNGKTHHMLIKAAKDVAEFGRDIFLDLMEKTKSEVNTTTRTKSITELDIVSQVRCPKCKIILRLTSESFNNSGYCFGCGHYVDGWSKC